MDIFGAFSNEAYQWIGLFGRLVDALPVSYAFGAGMLASVNPCGFIMLPAFAAFYFTAGGSEENPAVARSLVRAVQMGLLVTLAFVVTFGTAGAVISAGGYFITRWIGWAGMAVGAGLIAFGGYQLVTRRSVFSVASFGFRNPRRATLWGVATFGVAYAVASLGCTLPIFMIVASSVFTGDGGYIEALLRFVEYAAGMGLVLTGITLGIAAFREPTTRLVSGVLPYVGSAGNALLVFAGAYLIWYWVDQGQVI